jgi:hypothetical protein
VLCKSCRVGQKQVISLSPGVVAAMSLFAGGPPESPPHNALDKRVYGELRGVLNHYWSHLLGHELRMHRYLQSVAV